MDEQKIYQFLCSGNEKQENQGLKLLNAHKDTLLRKHRFPNHFNEGDRNSAFNWSIFNLHKNIKDGRFQYRGKGSLESYLFTLIKREIQRKNREKRFDELTRRQENQHAITNKPFPKEILEKVSQLFDQKLGERCRRILLMRYQEGMRQREIAEELGLALGTVRNRSSECMNELTRLIDENPDLGEYLRNLLK